MNKVDEKRREKILNGNLFSIVFTICLPLFIYNLFNSLYSFVDTIMVSEISMEGVASVAAISQIKSMFEAIGVGLAGGASILIAKTFGEGDYEKGNKIIKSLMTLAIIFSLALCLICIPFSSPILLLCGLDSKLLGISTGYFIIQIICCVVIMFNSIFIGIQKAKGDTKSIFYLNIIAMLSKLGLTSFFIYGFKVSNTIWVAIATLLSQLILLLILYFIVNKKDSVYKASFVNIFFDKKIIKDILLISFPIMLGKFIFAFGKVSVNSMCKSYENGGMVVGALSISNHICGLVTSPTGSFEDGESAIVSQNLGCNNKKRTLKTFYISLLYSCIIGIVGYILVRFVFQDALINIFSKTQSELNGMTSIEFTNLIKMINDYDTLSIIALSFNSVVLGLLYGYGKTKTTMIINISRVFAFRIPVLWILQTFFPELGAKGAGISMGISNILIAIMSFVVLIIFLLNEFVFKKKKENLVNDN